MLRPLAIAILLALPISARPQNPNPQSLAGTHSIGDAIHVQDSATAAARSAPHIEARSLTPTAAQPTEQPIHIIYVHGINQVGPNDSSLLRAGICRYIGECTVAKLERIYAAGPFAVNAPPPTFTYLDHRIWNTSEEWSASAPFIDRYQISGGSHTPILLDELNWWPIVYPLKCKALIAPDAHLTGPAKEQIAICNAKPGGTQPDLDHPGRFLQYQWITDPEASALLHLHRRATFLNRSLKNSLMDWGIGDAVLALGPIQQLLTAGIRELLTQSLQSAGVDLATANPQDSGPEFFFITHSLGSYLSLAAIDADWLGATHAGALPQFAISAGQKSAADYLSAHTAGFYFLANQVELLELARISVSDQAAATAPCPVSPPSSGSETPPAPAPPSSNASAASAAELPASTAISHWQCQRQIYLERRSAAHGPSLLGPQIISWSDPDDLLSWNVPRIDPVRVVNLLVHNSAFKIPPFLVWPTGAHANYAKNPRVLRVIFEPTSGS